MGPSPTHIVDGTLHAINGRQRIRGHLPLQGVVHVLQHVQGGRGGVNVHAARPDAACAAVHSKHGRGRGGKKGSSQWRLGQSSSSTTQSINHTGESSVLPVPSLGRVGGVVGGQDKVRAPNRPGCAVQTNRNPCACAKRGVSRCGGQGGAGLEALHWPSRHQGHQGGRVGASMSWGRGHRSAPTHRPPRTIVTYQHGALRSVSSH